MLRTFSPPPPHQLCSAASYSSPPSPTEALLRRSSPSSKNRLKMVPGRSGQLLTPAPSLSPPGSSRHFCLRSNFVAGRLCVWSCFSLSQQLSCKLLPLNSLWRCLLKEDTCGWGTLFAAKPLLRLPPSLLPRFSRMRRVLCGHPYAEGTC